MLRALQPLALLLLACTLLAACGREDPVLATYRGGEVTASEYRGWLSHRRLEDDPELRPRYLEVVATLETLAAEARDRGAEADPRLRYALRRAGEQVLAAALRRRVAQGVSVPEAAVDEMLAAQEEQRFHPPKVRLRNLFKGVAKDATRAEREAVRAEVEKLRARAEGGEDFGALARKESESETRFREGRMGAIEPGQLPTAIEKVAFSLPEGAISPVLETPTGFVLLKVEEKLEARTLSVEEARDRIRDYLTRVRVNEELERWTAELVKDAGPAIDLEAAADSGTAGATVVASARGAELTREQLLMTLQLQPGRPEVETLLRGRLAELIRGELQRQILAAEARRQGLHREPGAGGRLHWRRMEILATEGSRLLMRDRFVPPREKDIRAYWEEHRESFRVPDSFLISLIRLPLEEKRPLPGQVRSAEDLLASIREGTLSFEEAARGHSTHPSRQRGGHLGWRSKRRLAALGPNVLGTLLELRPGDLGGPVRQDRGLWILRLHDLRPGREMEFTEARSLAERVLGQSRTGELQQQVEEEVRASLDLRIVEPRGAPAS